MANDETLAALERAAAVLDQRAQWNDFPAARKQAAQDAALIRAHIETLRNGGGRLKAQWCSKRHDCALADGHEGMCYSAIAGAHLKGEGHVADD